METSTLASVLRVHEWIDQMCATETDEDQNSWGQHSTGMGNKTPLCDMLLSRGVLPARNARRWAEDSEFKIEPPFHNCWRRRLHDVMDVPDQSLPHMGEDPGTFRPRIDQRYDGILSPNLEETKPSMSAIFEQPDREKWPLALKARHDQTRNKTLNRHTPGVFLGNVTRQYVFLLEHFRSVLLSCSTTIAAFSWEILDISRHTAAHDGGDAGSRDVV
ncbi:hypothetical protein AYL99_02092 [Fonsecaea erecta]|uniref:Uncharacterized protein n=1 Tax=Fonsecaea erecta TaxID=1367422 RepID=A0A178ZUU8_9EURO|nr:hypothetical protein AYL99_02092 [Fonsecaea erecta]OAP62865.1 hypothetical protein AYL99_02092 [Fonsecaea erecta]